uniref:Uncharacterized protein n=1 Tax=Sphaerodactylus townsendi TaxID=933632 RepID=A0ACB8FSH2_9SAUR
MERLLASTTLNRFRVCPPDLTGDGGELPSEDVLLANLPLKRIVRRLDPQWPLRGQTVTLIPAGKPEIITCTWYRDEEVESKEIFTYIPSIPEQQNGPAFTGRESAGPNCSLAISRLTLNDTGIYIVRKTVRGGPETGHAQVQVSDRLDKPTVSAFPCPYGVEFNDSVTLTCETLSGSATVRWFKNSRPLGKSVRIHLTGNNRTLSIPNITRDEAGLYQCEVSDSANTEISDVKYVDVIYGPEVPVIHPPERLYREHSDLRLTCEADTFPDAHYIWFCNGLQCGTKSELLIQNVTLKHSGNYVCQAMNVLTLQKRNTTQEIEVEGGE